MALTKAKASNILLTTPAASSNDVTPATTEYVTTALANLADSAPSTLNTLNELAAALGDDASFSTTVTNSIATKAPLASPDFTGQVQVTNSATTVQELIVTGNNTRSALSMQSKDSSGNAVDLRMHSLGDGPRGEIFTFTNHDLGFATNNAAPQMILKTDGKVGIGTTSPAQTLHVNGNAFVSGQTFLGDASGDTVTLTGSLAHAGNFTIDAGGDFTIDAAGDIILDADGDDWKFAEGGSVQMELKHESSSMDFLLNTTNDDFKFKGSDDGTTITALHLDMSNGGRANFNNDIGLNDDRGVRFGSNDDSVIYNDGSNLYIKNSTLNHDIIFQGNDDGSAITALTLDMSLNGNATFNKHISHTTTNATHYFGSNQAFSSSPAIGRAGGNNFHISGTTTGDLAIGGETGQSIVFGTSQSGGIIERMRIRNTGTMYLSDPDSGNYVASFTSQVKANAINVGPYATFGTDYSGWGSCLGWNVRPKIGTTSTGFEAATNYYAAGASMVRMAGNTFGVTTWTASEIAQSNIGAGTTFISLAASGATTLGQNSGNLTDNYALKVRTSHGLGEQGSHNSSYYHHNTDRTYFYFSNACYASGGFHSYSDEKLKKNITTISGALDDVAKMNGVTFNWKDPETRGSGKTGKQFGVIAQNMLEVDPELPLLENDPLSPEETIETDESYYSMDYSRITPFLIEAIKELKEKLETAEARITELEG